MAKDTLYSQCHLPWPYLIFLGVTALVGTLWWPLMSLRYLSREQVRRYRCTILLRVLLVFLHLNSQFIASSYSRFRDNISSRIWLHNWHWSVKRNSCSTLYQKIQTPQFYQLFETYLYWTKSTPQNEVAYINQAGDMNWRKRVSLSKAISNLTCTRNSSLLVSISFKSEG